MVSSGTVNNDLSSFNNSMTSYNSNVTDLNSSWKGQSYENLNAKAEEFVNEFKSALQGQLSAFASACDLYQQYIQEKQAYNAALSNYNSAVANNDPNAGAYQAEASQRKQRMDQLKAEIESNLTAASSPSLAASSTDGSSIISGTPLNLSPGVYDLEFTGSNGRTMKYHVYIPEGATEGMPLVVYLHGDGSVNKFDYLKTHEMAKAVDKVYGNNYPFIFIQPMTEVTSWTQGGRLDTLAELIQNVSAEYKCNTNKVVLTGASRGGMGAWDMANKYPNLFSAVIPIAGTGNIDPNNFINLPIVAVSSTDSSDSWNFENMKSNIKKIQNAGGSNSAFVPANGYSHSNVLFAGITKDIMDWALAQTRTVSI